MNTTNKPSVVFKHDVDNCLYLTFNQLRWGRISGDYIVLEYTKVNGGEFLETFVPKTDLVPIYSLKEHGGEYPTKEQYRIFNRLIRT